MQKSYVTAQLQKLPHLLTQIAERFDSGAIPYLQLYNGNALQRVHIIRFPPMKPEGKVHFNTATFAEELIPQWEPKITKYVRKMVVFQ